MIVIAVILSLLALASANGPMSTAATLLDFTAILVTAYLPILLIGWAWNHL